MQAMLSYAQQTEDTLRTTYLEEVIVKSRRLVKGDTLAPGLKMTGKLIETPQNIISINSNLLKMQGIFEVQDALRNASGLYVNSANGTTNVFSGLSEVNVRGFNGAIMFRNGLPSSGAGVSQEDVALIEQIDVVKGPAGFINAMGPGGGSINITTKTPRNNAIGEATITFGSFNFYRASVDLGSALKDKGFSYRFNAAYETQHYYFDYAQRRKLLIAPVIQYNFSKRTSLLAEWNMTQGRALYGSQFGKSETEAFVQKDSWKANYLADPGLPTSKLDEQYGRLVFTHDFNSNWKITSQSSIKSTPLDQWTLKAGNGGYGLPVFDESGEASRTAFQYKRDYFTYNTQAFINGKYNISSRIVHQLIAGLDFNSTRLLENQYSGAKSFSFNRNHPNYGINTDSLRVRSEIEDHYNIRNNTIGGYVYNTFNLDEKLFLTAGARWSRNVQDRKSDGYYSSDTATFKATSFNPRVGVSYLIQKDWAAFFTYDQSFEPQSGVDPDGNFWKPLQSYNTEIGIKKDWFNGQLSTTISAYKIIRNNSFSVDPVSNRLRQVNQVRNKGIEIDVIGSPSKNLTLTANYSLINSVYSKDEYTPELVGKAYASVPKHQVNSWALYTITEGKLKGLSLGLGQTAVMGRATDVEGINLPNYLKLDGTVMYQLKNWYIRGTLDNITNKRYITDGTVSDRYNADWSQIIGQTWNYQESIPFNFKVQVGIRFK